MSEVCHWPEGPKKKREGDCLADAEWNVRARLKEAKAIDIPLCQRHFVTTFDFISIAYGGTNVVFTEIKAPVPDGI